MARLRLNIDDSQTEIQIDDTTTLPTNYGVITIESEQISYQYATDRAVVGCTRGYNGTSAALHDEGTEVMLLTEPTSQVSPMELSATGGPTDNLTGVGFAESGTRYTDLSNGQIWTNVGTTAEPTWEMLQAGTDNGITQLTGDVTAGPGTGSQVSTISDNVVTAAKMDSETATIGQVLTADGTGAATWEDATGGITELTGDATAGPGSGSQALTLADTTVIPGSYTATNLTVDSKGRITAATDGSGGAGSPGAPDNSVQFNGTILIELVNSTNISAIGFVAATPLALTPVSFTAGNLLVLETVSTANTAVVTAVTDDNGNTWQHVPNATATGPGGFNQTSDIWYAENSNSGSTTISVTFDANCAAEIVALEYSGVATSSALLTGSGSNTTDVGAPLTPALTPDAPNQLLVSVGGSQSINFTGITGPWISRQVGNVATGADFADYINPPLSPQTGAFTPTDSQGYISSGAIFKPASSGPAFQGDAALTWDNTNKRLGIGTDTPQSILDIQSTTEGMLPPRMTTTQRTAISSPIAGMLVYDTDLAKLVVYTTQWEAITSVGPV